MVVKDLETLLKHGLQFRRGVFQTVSQRRFLFRALLFSIQADFERLFKRFKLHTFSFFVPRKDTYALQVIEALGPQPLRKRFGIYKKNCNRTAAPIHALSKK